MLRVLSIHFNRAEHMPATQSCKRVYWTEPLLTRYLGAGFRLRRVSTGQVARQSGVNIQTLRYYERRGRLAAPPATPDWVPRLHITPGVGAPLCHAGPSVGLRPQCGT